MKERLDDLLNRKEAARNAGSERSVERQHAKGKMLARERIDYLLDPGSFHELDMLARHRAHESGLEEQPYTDGVITGWGERLMAERCSFSAKTSPSLEVHLARCSQKRFTR